MKLPTTVKFDTVNADDQPNVAQGGPFRPTGPYGIAKSCAATIAQLEAERAGLPRSERQAVNKRLRLVRDVMRWCKTRHGYVEPTA